MPTPGPDQSGRSTSDMSTVREFVAGFQARNAQSTKNGLRSLAAGVVASALISAGQASRKRKAGR